MVSPQRPLTGARLTYSITMGGISYRVRVKESIGNWLGLSPTTGTTGTFSSGPQQGKTFQRPSPGFRFQSYKFLVAPGTTIVEPTPGCESGSDRERSICSFSLGFPKGPKANPITTWRVISWAKNTTRASSIIGIITPRGVKHQWRGSLTGRIGQGAELGGGLLPLPNLPGLPLINP